MRFSEGGLGKAFLRFAAPFTKLRRFPVIGPGLRWASAKLIPRDALTWVQVQHGPAQGIWLHLNPRTGRDYFHGDVEPEVQVVLRKYLRPGMTVYDIAANIGFFSLLTARLVGSAGGITASKPTRKLRHGCAKTWPGIRMPRFPWKKKRCGLLQIRCSSLAQTRRCPRIAVWGTLSTTTRKDQRPARSESKPSRWTNMYVNPQRRISSSVMWKVRK